ncbi:MAG TPA: glycosyltransferase family 39 protein [Gemmataceae bacterium]|nr:glycosyltransferase family 39 protein [Gemmataceae bacterium]
MGSWWDVRKPEFWTWALVGLGLGLRLFHYLRDPSIWHDEAALIVNVLGKNFQELLGPLFLSEAGPPLFLWLERAMVLLFGDSTYALRFLPFLASCLALVLMVPVARRFLRPEAVPRAILLMACSDKLLWHGCEAKPYAVEVLAATASLAVYTWTESSPLTRRLVLFTFLSPFLIFVAYPGCFLCGGLVLALFPAVRRQNQRAIWLRYGILCLVIAGSFALLALGPARAQRCGDMVSCWVRQFPNWDKPWTVPGWTLFSTLDMVRYCFDPTGHVLALIAFLGAVVLWRNGQHALVMLLCAPWLLALLAAFAGAYPFGGARVEVFALPALALLIGAGLPSVRTWLTMYCRPAGFAVALLFLVPLATVLYGLAVPWPRADCHGAARFVLDNRQEGDPIIANHWEYLYYFRKVGPALVPLGMTPAKEDMPQPDTVRFWLVLTGGSQNSRDGLASSYSPDVWQTLEKRNFAMTEVRLLVRRDTATALTQKPQGESSSPGDY